MLRWCIKTFLGVVLTLSLFGQANPGGGVNIPTTAGTTITPQTCTGGQALTAAAANGVFTCSAVGGGGATRGVFASAPTCNAGAAGSTYFATDAGLVGECNGTTRIWKYGPMTVTPTTLSVSNTWYNQSSAVVANNSAGSGVLLTGTGTGGVNIQGRLHAVPATPYTYTICFSRFGQVSSGNGGVGILWTDGTTASDKAVLTGIFGPEVFHSKYSNATSFSAGYTSTNPGIGAAPVCIAQQDDGTTRKIAISYDKATWFTFDYAGEGHTDFLTPTQLGYYTYSGAAGVQTAVIISEDTVASTLF